MSIIVHWLLCKVCSIGLGQSLGRLLVGSVLGGQSVGLG